MSIYFRVSGRISAFLFVFRSLKSELESENGKEVSSERGGVRENKCQGKGGWVKKRNVKGNFNWRWESENMYQGKWGMGKGKDVSGEMGDG